MDKERLFRFIDKKYASKREMYTALPLGMNADELWDEVLDNRRSKGVILPIRNAAGQSYWYTLTDTMIKASENIVDELFDTEITEPITSVSPIKEIFFTGYMEGAQISIRDAMSFLQSGEEPHDVEELMILNNRQAGTFAAENIHHPINEQYLRSLAGILTNGLDNGGGDFRTSDEAEILSMQGEDYTLPRAIDLSDRVRELTSMLADPGIHPMIKAAAAQAWVLVTRPFPEGNERLGRLLSEIILIRSGYTFFGEISISATIAQNGYDYFNAIAKIIREENGADLTYFIEYYLSVLSSAVDDYRVTRRKQDEENIEAERELARVPLSTKSTK